MKFTPVLSSSLSSQRSLIRNKNQQQLCVDKLQIQVLAWQDLVSGIFMKSN